MLETETFVKLCSVVMDPLVGGTYSSAARTRSERGLSRARPGTDSSRLNWEREWTFGDYPSVELHARGYESQIYAGYFFADPTRPRKTRKLHPPAKKYLLAIQYILLGIHIVQSSLRGRPCLLFASYFPNYVFYVPNPCVLGTRPVLPCKNRYFCKLELVRAKT